jgi:hypothetical protein
MEMTIAEKFDKYGYAYFSNILTEEQTERFSNLMIELKKNSILNYEGAVDNPYYKESYGGNHDEFELALREVTPRVEEELGVKLKPANTYARIYYNGGTLPSHKDREGLDYVMSITLKSTLKKDWPLWCEDKLGNHIPLIIKRGDGGMMMGNTMNHWRENLICAPDEYVIQLFMHWSFI